MSRTITIDPVTRIEGHAKITIQVDDAGRVEDVRFHVTEFRGFEKFCEGRSFWEMPGITARICGICPVSHLLASAKAGDAIMGITIPPAAEKLRRLMNWGQYVQSHALSFFHLSAPDLLLGMDSDPAARNIIGLINAFPETAKNGIRLRRIGQEIIRSLGGKSIHPSWCVPGGVREPLSVETRDRIKQMLPDALDITMLAIDMLKDTFESHAEEARTFGHFPSLFAGLVTPDGGLEHYDGVLRVMDADGKLLEAGLDPAAYRTIISEAVEPWSYLKFPYYRPLGYADGAGMYRVGALARINICDFIGTPGADRELRQFRRLGEPGKPVISSFHYHYARLIEVLFALEKIGETLEQEDITTSRVRSDAGVNQPVGIGVSEAPRGTLFHEYHVDVNGILEQANLIIATGQNNLAMNRTIRQIADRYVRDGMLNEGILNRIEHGIRTYDPCLSCSTHAVGRMPIEVLLIDRSCRVIDRVCREE